MPITIDYGGNPSVYGMAAFQAGQNRYRQRQQQTYLPFVRDQQQFERQAYLTRLELEERQQRAQNDLIADQQRQAQHEEHNTWRLQYGEREANRRAAMGLWGDMERARIGAESRKKPVQNDPFAIPRPDFGAKPAEPEQRPAWPPKDLFGEDDQPLPPPGQRPGTGDLAGGTPWDNASPRERVMFRAQQRANMRDYRAGSSPRFPGASQGYVSPGGGGRAGMRDAYTQRPTNPYNMVRGSYRNKITGEMQPGVYKPRGRDDWIFEQG